ncbi:MAG: hypothetical protein NTU89_02955, partial [Candidatus Dependentiae bacterium]|nr:hypothetical protein [Candidatus Dependentiae bacterium]
VKAVLRLAQKSDEQLLVLKGKDQIPFKQSIVKYYTKAKGIYESATKIYKEIIKDGLKTSAKEEQEGLATEIYHGIEQALEEMRNLLPVENESGVLDQNTKPVNVHQIN